MYAFFKALWCGMIAGLHGIDEISPADWDAIEKAAKGPLSVDQRQACEGWWWTGYYKECAA